KIAMLIETWDRVRLSEQNTIIGRDKGEGAPLSGGDEFADPDFSATDAAGAPLMPAVSHVRLAHPDLNDGVRILRRGYNFVDGNNDLGRLDAGLFFLSYQRAPEQFVRLQRSLSTDVMSEYIRHVGSGLWAVPPGATPGSYVGVGLFA
ncbi:MAG: Dyp-type peroxidase, partial [Microbacterium sp.]